jgi:DNA primase
MEHDRLDFVAAVETLASIAACEVPRDRGARTDDELHGRLLKRSRRRTNTFRRCCVSTRGATGRRLSEVARLTGVSRRDFGIGFAPPDGTV